VRKLERLIKLKKGNYIVKVDDGTTIYGMTSNKLYTLIGYSEEGNFVIKNNSQELIEVHSS
jgi:hypothetical protein